MPISDARIYAKYHCRSFRKIMLRVSRWPYAHLVFGRKTFKGQRVLLAHRSHRYTFGSNKGCNCFPIAKADNQIVADVML